MKSWSNPGLVKGQRSAVREEAVLCGGGTAVVLVVIQTMPQPSSPPREDNSKWISVCSQCKELHKLFIPRMCGSLAEAG